MESFIRQARIDQSKYFASVSNGFISQITLICNAALVWPSSVARCFLCLVFTTIRQALYGAYEALTGRHKLPDMIKNTAGGSGKPKLCISWPGYGLLFWWQLGVLQYLQEHFDLSDVPVVGSSAGAFISIFSRCGVHPQDAFDLAHQLAVENNIFTRPLGLLGIWKPIIKQWMYHLLPSNAASLCSGGGATILLVDLPDVSLRRVSEFDSVEDLVEAATCSAHIPWFLDWKFSSNYKGGTCIDGGFRYVMLQNHDDLLPVDARATLMLDPRVDPRVRLNFTLFSCVRLLSVAGFQEMMKWGYEFGHKLHRDGVLDQFDVKPLPSVLAADGEMCTPVSQRIAATLE